MKIASAGNTVVPAYLVIRSKGYSIRREPGTKVRETWYAEKGDIQLMAEDPLALLGLVALAEERGEDWKALDSEIDAFTTEFGRGT